MEDELENYKTLLTEIEDLMAASTVDELIDRLVASTGVRAKSRL